MKLALAEAQKQQGFCAPNPAVGAIAVLDGKVIAAGYHRGPGTPHAEVDALEGVSDEACKELTLYVTLEPCCHFGRTPPCTDLIVKRGVRRVVYGFEDPNPVVTGHGRSQLQQQGVECTLISVPEVDAFYESYRRWWKTGKPRLTAKLALSLDGKIAGPNGQRMAITGKDAARFTHEWRKRCDGILTTAQTIIQDDPQLNVRLDADTYAKPVYILDRLGRLPWNAKIIRTALEVTLFHGIEADECRLEALKGSGVRLVRTPSSTQAFLSDKTSGLDLEFIVDYLGKTAKAHDIWVEAGGISFSQLAKGGFLSRAFILIAPKWLGKEATNAFDMETELLFNRANRIQWSGLGDDGLMEVHWD